jgi:hypothetical protein
MGVYWRIESPPVVRLTEIKSLGAGVNGHSDVVVPGCNVAAEERAGDGGCAKQRPGVRGSCLGVHVNLLISER